ncbi:MAG: hypothetical protein GY798_24735 [Hyphomicrobiales bacterium]|nr:hypothetical protein [Hyphomicrobiales bacterium]
MRGNLPTIHLDIFGNGFYGAGALPIYMNFDRTRIEVGRYCYIYSNFFDGERPCTSWGYPTAEHGQIIGMRVSLNVSHGARSGRKTLWLAGQPVAFDLSIPDPPSANEARLDTIEVVTVAPPYEPLQSVQFGQPFKVRLVFNQAPGTNSETVIVQDPINQREFTVSAYPTEFSRIFLTDVLTAGEPEAEGVPQ